MEIPPRRRTILLLRLVLAVISFALLTGFFHNRPSSEFQQVSADYTLAMQRGDLGEAEVNARQMVELSRKEVGPQHTRSGAALLMLGVVYAGQGRHADAEVAYRKSLSILEKSDGPEHEITANALCNLGATLAEQKRYDEGEPLIKRAFAIWEKAKGSDHSDLLCPLQNLAIIATKRDRFEEAESLIQRGNSIAMKLRGGQNPHSVALMGILAELRARQGKAKEAEELMRLALTFAESLFGRDHPLTAIPREKLGQLLKVQGRDAEAEPLLKRAQAMREMMRKSAGCDTLDERIVLAMKLFDGPGQVGVEGLSFADMTSGKAEVWRNAWKGGGNLAESFRMGARALAKELPEAVLTIRTVNQPTLENILAIAGKEDSTEEGKTTAAGKNIPVPVKWHKYGWTHFAVAEGKIVAVRAVCR